MIKTLGDIIILHMCTKNYDQIMHGSCDMVRDGRTDRRTDGWTNGWKRLHIVMGASPKNWRPITGEEPFTSEGNELGKTLYLKIFLMNFSYWKKKI